MIWFVHIRSNIINMLMIWCSTLRSRRPGSATFHLLQTALMRYPHGLCMQNALLLNTGKTEAVIFGTRQRLASLDIAGALAWKGASCSSLMLSTWLVQRLMLRCFFDKHVTKVVRACTFHTCALRHIRPLLTLEAAKKVAVSIVWSRLDYCNSLLCGTTERNLDRLQPVQNTLARVICRASWSTSVLYLSQQLHWLPVRQRVRLKLAATTFMLKHCGLSAYLHKDLHDYQPTRMLRSSTAHLPQWPLVHTSVVISCLHRRCTYRVELTLCKHSICWQFASFKCELFASTYDGSALSQRSDSCFARPIALVIVARRLLVPKFQLITVYYRQLKFTSWTPTVTRIIECFPKVHIVLGVGL